MQYREKNSKQILTSATLASWIVTVLTNPLDVIKVRLQKDAKNCSVGRNPHYCQSSSHTRYGTQHGMFKLSSLNLKSTILTDHYRAFCSCIPYQTNYKALKYLTQTEGMLTLINGLKHSLMAATISNVIYLYSYETIRAQMKKLTQHQILLPLCTSAVARTITTSLIFPFDYWKTKQQSLEGHGVKISNKLDRGLRSGYGALLQRDILFSGIYWILVENTRRFIKYMRRNLREDTYEDHTTLLISNAIAGGFSGGVASIFSLPLDVVKTRKQLYPQDYYAQSNYSILYDIYHKEGLASLFAGYRARVLKATLSCAGILTLYELFIHIQKTKHILE